MDTKTQNLIEQHTELIIEGLDCLRREAEHSRHEVTKGAAECQAAYDKIKDDPEAQAALDASHSMYTTAGLKHMAQIFRESAETWSEKLATLGELTRALDPDYDDDNEQGHAGTSLR
jgi:hypothetical protein